MQAMVLHKQGEELKLEDIDKPSPDDGQLLLKVSTCGICRTDLHVLDGDLKEAKLPLVMGHQIVARVEDTSHARQDTFKTGDIVGVPWLGYSCGECFYCKSARENLCDNARYTGYQVDGGFAEYCVADERFCFPIPENYPDLQAAPLLCAGLIGYRSYRMTGDAERLGFYGFGSAAHILAQVAIKQEREIYAFTREGDNEGQAFAKKLGAVWAGSSKDKPPKELDAAIIFAPVGDLVPAALRALRKGGTVVCAGIHMSEIPAFPYEILWNERVVRSVANLTRKDGEEFLQLAPEIPVETEVHEYPLEKTNDALNDLREGNFTGSAVIRISQD